MYSTTPKSRAWLFLLATHTLRSTLAQTCYCKAPGGVFNCSSAQQPCGPANDNGFVACCVPPDICGADGFCHFTHPQTWGSGYYQGGCTDPRFQDPMSCSTHCTDFVFQDCVFSPEPPLWACCFNDTSRTSNCSAPNNETWEAPSPEELFATPFSVLTRTSSTSALGVTASTSALSTTSSTANAFQSSAALSSTSSDLSTGEKVGIGVGVSLAAVIICIGALVITFRRRRNGSRPVMNYGSERKVVHEMDERHQYKAEALNTRAELPHSLRSPVELSNHSVK